MLTLVILGSHEMSVKFPVPKVATGKRKREGDLVFKGFYLCRRGFCWRGRRGTVGRKGQISKLFVFVCLAAPLCLLFI